MIPIEKAKGGERVVRRYKSLYEAEKHSADLLRDQLHVYGTLLDGHLARNEELGNLLLDARTKLVVEQKRELRFRKKAAAANRHADELAREVKARGKALLRYRQGAETIISATHLANSTTTLHGRAER